MDGSVGLHMHISVIETQQGPVPDITFNLISDLMKIVTLLIMK